MSTGQQVAEPAGLVLLAPQDRPGRKDLLGRRARKGPQERKVPPGQRVRRDLLDQLGPRVRKVPPVRLDPGWSRSPPSSASGAAQALAAPANGSSAYRVTVTANLALSLSGGTAGQWQRVYLRLIMDATGGWTVTWPSQVGTRWPGNVAPTPATAPGSMTVVWFDTDDGGTTWVGGY